MIDLADVATVFDTLAKWCRNPPPDDVTLKKMIFLSAEMEVKGLQAILGVNVDGIFGPISTKALQDANIEELTEKILAWMPDGTVQPPAVSPPVVSPTSPAPSPTSPPPSPTLPIPVPNPSPDPSPTIPNSIEYAHYFSSMTINTNRLPEVESIASKILKNQSRYESVANAIGMTYWPLIGAIHNLESSMNFGTHLYNGDPLSERTVHHPVGHPVSGDPPFTWEFSATDALRYEGWDAWYDWTILGMAYISEKYNGTGYRSHGVPSPYLWSGSSIYVQGLYTSDGVFSPTAVSRQIGVMTMLRYFFEHGGS